jgi:sec-independent protein translocase protein TatC
MYLLKKVIQLREHAHPDHEKPFLEHLEDLRTMITRVVITLVISMIICFAFNKQLMEFFRHPVDQVLVAKLEATLPTDAPRPPTVESWGTARKVEHAAMNLLEEERELFYKSLADEELVFQAKSISLLRAALVLPEEKRDAFVNSLDESDEFKLQVKALVRTKPSTDSDVQGNLKMMSALKPTEGFMLSMKLSFVAGIVLAFPLLLLFILQFVLPGLHSHEKRVMWPAMAVGFGLFLAGTAFAYYWVLPRALLFFYQWSGDMGISNDWRIGEYISFATQFTLLFGLSFELPVVVMVFVKLGMLSYETMSKTRSYAIVGIFVAAAILTPTPDVFTLLLMAAPMIILYEICIWLAYFDRKKNRILEEQEARERMERQLLREEQMRAEEQSAHDHPQPDDWHQNHPDTDHHAHEAGDDGWHEEYPQQDHHASDEIPELDETPPEKKSEDGDEPGKNA